VTTAAGLDFEAIQERCIKVPGIASSDAAGAYCDSVIADLRGLLPMVETQVSAASSCTGARAAGQRVLAQLQRVVARHGDAHPVTVWDAEDMALAGRLALRLVLDGDQVETYCYWCHQFRPETRLVRQRGRSAYACPDCQCGYDLVVI
jgi:hypothetical protein